MTEYEEMFYDTIIADYIATEDELNLAFNMTDNGWKETLDRVLFIRTGYRSLEQYIEYEHEEEEEE